MNDSNCRPHRIAKVGHRKSRRGCKICRARRVKCDETHPVCGSCTRLHLDCAWPEEVSRQSSPRDPIANVTRVTGNACELLTPGESPSSTQLERSSEVLQPRRNLRVNPLDIEKEDIDIPETRNRRLLEHRLMQNYIQHMSRPLPVNPDPDWMHLFTHVIPKLALTHDNLLYALLTTSASHLLLTEPDDVVLSHARQTYLILAMREQRKMVERLNVDTADAVCFASLLLCINSFSMMRDRSLDPYTPPLDHLHIGRGAGTVIWLSVEAARKSGNFENSTLHVITKSYPRFTEDQSYFSPALRKDFEGVMTQTLLSGDVMDIQTREAYGKTLSYIGSIQNAIRIGEPTYALCRRIQAFPLLIPSKFIGFLEEQRPRALVVLAHFFAAVAQVHGVWWLREDGDGTESTAQREIRAISKVLPHDWQPLMAWPLDMVGLG